MKTSTLPWMIVVCIVPLAILFFAGDKLFSGGYSGQILIGIFIVAHMWMMLKGRGAHSENRTDHDKPDTTKDHSCCH